jgi:hypothetical protein
MDDFEYIPEYKVLICRKHKYAVKGLDRHLKDAHGLRKKGDRQPILDKYSSLVLLEPKDVPSPPDNCLPFEALGNPYDIWQCSECNERSSNYKTMRGHCNTRHHWQVTKEDPTHWTVHKGQTFFGVGYQRFFFTESRSTVHPVGFVVQDNNVEVEKQLVRKFHDIDKQDQIRLQVADSKMEKTDNTGWWNFVQ